jgi:hypothetical protein
VPSSFIRLAPLNSSSFSDSSGIDFGHRTPTSRCCGIPHQECMKMPGLSFTGAHRSQVTSCIVRT